MEYFFSSFAWSELSDFSSFLPALCFSPPLVALTLGAALTGGADACFADVFAAEEVFVCAATDLEPVDLVGAEAFFWTGAEVLATGVDAEGALALAAAEGFGAWTWLEADAAFACFAAGAFALPELCPALVV